MVGESGEGWCGLDDEVTPSKSGDRTGWWMWQVPDSRRDGNMLDKETDVSVNNVDDRINDEPQSIPESGGFGVMVFG